MDALSAHSYDTLVELERESYYEKKLRRWLSSFSCGDCAFIWQCYYSSSHLIGLAFVRGHYLLLGPRLEMCHHWRC